MPRLATVEENDLLISPVTPQEIKNTIFQMNTSKAPGPDGFGAGLFQNHWSIIGHKIMGCILNFFRQEKLLKEVKYNHIALIPKVDNRAMTSQFQPVSLCNNLHKIIFKILVNRMRPILECIFSPEQIVPKRAIHDNVLVAYNIMNKLTNMKAKHAYMAPKLNKEKTYHRLEWDSIFSCLKDIGFHDR